MRKTLVMGAVALTAGLGASARAAVTLPSSHVQVTSDAVFDTTFEPKIDVATGLLVDPGVMPELSVYGEVVNIADAFDSDKKGSVSGELTFKFTASLEADPASLTPRFSPDGKQVSYMIVTSLKNADLKFYDDDTPDFNALKLVGKSASDAGVNDATDGELYIHATPADDNLRGNIEISFFRVSDGASFTNFKITQQYVNSTTQFDVIGGSLHDQSPNAVIEGINAGQVGPYPSSGKRTFDTETLGQATVNKAVDELVRANSSALINTGNVVPEPASASFVVLAAAGLLARRRRA